MLSVMYVTVGLDGMTGSDQRTTHLARVGNVFSCTSTMLMTDEDLVESKGTHRSVLQSICCFAYVGAHLCGHVA